MTNQPSYEDISRLVVRMREGSKEARREIIEAHVGLAFKEAMAYEDDEALSDALVTLVEEVDNFRTSGRHPAALPAFLKVAIHNAAGAHCRNDRRPGPGRRDERGWLVGGGGHQRHCAMTDAKKFLHSGRGAPEYHDLRMVDLMDQLLTLCETEEEREMIYHRSLSLSYNEVALRTGSNYAHVQRSLERLSLRFQTQEKLERTA